MTMICETAKQKRLLDASAELLAAAQAAERKLVEIRSILSDHGIVAPCTDEIVKLQIAMIKAGG